MTVLPFPVTTAPSTLPPVINDAAVGSTGPAGSSLPPLAPRSLDEARVTHESAIGFMHDNTPPREWVDQLRAISPINDEHGWLEFVWEAGDPWVPGQRWALYEMIHRQFLDPALVQELEGPHPRSEGHMCSVNVPHQFQCLCRRKLEAWRGGPCQLITLAQWKLYQRTGSFGQPFWVIQGSQGGHKAEFNEIETTFLRQADQSSEAPRVGTLPYAPFDNRVVQQIVRYNKLEAMGMQLDEFRRAMAGSGYDQHKARLAKELRAQYVEHLSTQMADVNEAFIRAAKSGEMDDQPRTEIDWERVEEASTANFIETGHLLHPSLVT